MMYDKPTPGLTRAQIDARTGKLFSTDVAAALGADKYKTPIQLYLEKRGEASQFGDYPDYESPARFGLHFQDAIGKLYTERTGLPLIREGRTLYHPEHPWMGSHFDYRVAGKPNHGVEIKFFNSNRRKEFGDAGSADMPTKPFLQCLHQMAVAKFDTIDLVVLFGNLEDCIFSIERDPDAIDLLITREQIFMAHVQSGTMPEPISAEDLRILYPKDSGKMIEANAKAFSDVESYSSLDSLIKQAEKQREEIKERLLLYMEDAAVLSHNGQILLTYKSDNHGEPVRKAKKGYLDVLRKNYPDVWDEISEEQAPSRRFLCKL